MMVIDKSQLASKVRVITANRLNVNSAVAPADRAMVENAAMVVPLAARSGTTSPSTDSTTAFSGGSPLLFRTRICSDTTTALSTNSPKAIIKAAMDIISS